MKKVLFFMALLMTLCVNAQTIIFEENFDSTPQYALPSGWTTIRGSSNILSKAWFCTYPSAYNVFSGRVCANALANANETNDLVTPEIALGSGNSYSLSFSWLVYYKTNMLSVFVLEANDTFTGNETPVYQKQFSGTDVLLPNIDLSSYAGQNVKIYFRTKGLVDGLTSTDIDDVKITQQPLLGTSEIGANTTMGIYPNPSSDFVNLKTGSKITKAEVFDMAGRKVNAAVKDDKVDVRALQPGTYMINVETKNKKYSQKFIKK
ncbi:hypothetical protein C1637_07210 [Chryseobacterium lactis]|uniref:T9SS C-terminal target domain-containing protein n=1 Tax=Chryseobacterium lactis TaxID=1241981 RepID=A0A3G6RT07_CHRLC|nr:T9SS type A sorting domain-containing protein [Chryseobacterium lactis]AZA84618.1 T9SS C-terminal target domain-containing protein [Chryseobacterium lactis]AZB05006.1 T9SS C-terminal target domain-containing protein [Chryseobacterium lactis]PNW14737.1 hypothetical protein C1637_07210 [Chryseobacterium lactis]